MNGVIVVDKPPGWTSHDVVGKMRRLAGTKKIGHLGTLDPMATGVLPLMIDRATRLAQYFALNDKSYEGVVCFGYSTSTYDAEGEPTSPKTSPGLGASDFERAFAPFRGTFSQVPPPVSAKKIGGRPAYELARKNIPFELKPSDVTVHSLEIVEMGADEIKFRIHCGAGTYVRSIAHEAGQRLGCGAHLKSLRRTASGCFQIAQARTIEAIADLAAQDRIEEAVIPAAELLPEFPSEIVDQATETQIRHGRDFRVSPFRARGSARFVKAVSADGQLIAIGEAVFPNTYHPVVVL
jgi:tRNA pseudouridine55 synthase